VPGSYADALASLFGAKYPTWSLALNVSVPLGQSEAQAAAAKGRLQVEQADAQLRRIELQVASDVTNAAKTADSAAEAVRAAQAARELAEQSLNAEDEKFRVGLGTNFTVIQAQRDLSAARTGELQVVLAYRKALVELDRVQHTTLQSANVTVVSAN
jgi:outer membrane protein TolC